MATDARWPPFAEQATAAGVRSMLCLPLHVDTTTFGTLSVYADTPRAFKDVTESVARVLAVLAAITLSESRGRANLERALGEPGPDRAGEGDHHAGPAGHRRGGLRTAGPPFAGDQHEAPGRGGGRGHTRASSEPPRPGRLVGVDTLAELLSGLAVEHDARVALVEGDRALTFDGLAAAAGALAAELAGWGVGRGDVVALWLPNVLEYLVAEFALGALGAAALGVNTRYGEHELAAPGGARPAGRGGRAAPVPRHRLRRQAAAARARGSGWSGRRRTRTSPGSTSAAGCAALPDPTAGGAAALPGAGRAEDPVAYFTTSGSTGAPKLAGHPQAAVVEHAVNVARAFDMRPGDAVHLALPLCGVFGFSAAFGMLAAGGTCVLEPVFDAERMARDIGAHRVTHLVGGDDMLGRLMAVDPPAWPDCRRGAIADFGGPGGGGRAVGRRARHRPLRGVRVLGAVRADLDVARRAAPRRAGPRGRGAGVARRSRCGPSTRRRAPSARPARPVSCSSAATPSRRATSAAPRCPSTRTAGSPPATSAPPPRRARSTTGAGRATRCGCTGSSSSPPRSSRSSWSRTASTGRRSWARSGVAVAFVTLRPDATVTADELRDRCHGCARGVQGARPDRGARRVPGHDGHERHEDPRGRAAGAGGGAAARADRAPLIHEHAEPVVAALLGVAD